MGNIRRNIPQYVDWNSFCIDDMNSTQVVIYAHSLEKDITGDIEKLGILQRMPHLDSLTFCSDDFNVGIYMSELVKDMRVTKEFHLLDDFQNRDRSYINGKKLVGSTRFRSMPNSYIQWGKTKRSLNYGYTYIGNVAVSQTEPADSSDFSPSDRALDEIDKIISEFLTIPNLTFVDKVVLVSNYLQANIQFVEGRISHTAVGDYVCEDYSEAKYHGVNSVDNVIFDKIGKCNCIARTMMLMLNNPKMNVNCRIADCTEHAYCSVYDDSTQDLYVTDPTWCITHNSNRFPGTLKASSFSDEFILIGQDKLSTLEYHNTSNFLPNQFAKKSLNRETIRQSVEKLKSYGIQFHYPKVIPLQSAKLELEQENDGYGEL